MAKCEDAKSTAQTETLCDKKKEMIEKLKALGELPAATQLADLQTNNVFNNVFSEPGP